MVGLTSTSDGKGYWLAGADGGVFSYGEARFFGSLGGHRLSAPVVAMAATPDGRGYWLAGADGGVFTYGNAGYFGSLGSQCLAAPIVGMAPTPDGRGYWLVAGDGGVFTYGDAPYLGSLGGRGLSGPIVAMAPTPDGRGYWLVGADGGVFTYGDARYLGSEAGDGLSAPVTGVAATPDGKGYWLVAGDGGVFTFGDARFGGGLGGTQVDSPVAAMAVSPTGAGYWLPLADGGLYSYGDARFLGSPEATRVAAQDAHLGHPHPPVAIFYYPWYANPRMNGVYRHWDEGDHRPPSDIGSDYYPARGTYSSSASRVVEAQMADIASAGIGEVISSWWGPGSFEDHRLPLVARAARAHGLRLAVHIEPYVGRTPTTVAAEIARLRRTYGVTDFYVYRADEFTADEWAGSLRGITGVRIFATGDPDALRSGALEDMARDGAFQGVYTYDPYSFSGTQLPGVCALARSRGLACAPSVAPGFDAVRATDNPRIRSRRDGTTYDTMWEGAIDATPDVVTITSYNEWHEGSQLEADTSRCLPSHYCYQSYAGAWGSTGASSAGAYLARTRYWTSRLHTG